jgi:radical SAM superfamily enzyme YgiQ (UPF0313 family)
MKVLFLIPPAEHSLRKGHEKDNGYGLGRAYLMSYLKAHGHEVDTVPFNMCSDQEYLGTLYDKMISFRPDFISITMFSVNRVMGYVCIEQINKWMWDHAGKKIKIVVGGHHASALPNQLSKKYPFIQIVVGEGEIALLDIVEGRETGRIVERPLIQDLDSLPFPDHKYFFDVESGRKNAIMLTSRGCPMRPACSFCSLPSVSQAKYRKRSVLNVFEEILWIKTNLPQVINIGIQDDAFMMDNQRVIELCKLIVEHNININFAVSGRVHPVSDELLYWMDKAKMHMVSIGLETGNQDMIDRAHKKITLEQVENYFKLAKKYPKMVITTFLVAGLPGETWETVKNTVKFVNKLQKIKYDYVYDVNPTFVYPGTELYELMKQAGKIDDSYWLTDGDCPNYTVEHDVHTIMEMRRYILKRVSFLRIFTPIGFFHQFFNAPRNLLEVIWYHPENLKYALGDSFSIMFPKLYRKLRGDKIERRYEL